MLVPVKTVRLRPQFISSYSVLTDNIAIKSKCDISFCVDPFFANPFDNSIHDPGVDTSSKMSCFYGIISSLVVSVYAYIHSAPYFSQHRDFLLSLDSRSTAISDLNVF